MDRIFYVDSSPMGKPHLPYGQGSRIYVKDFLLTKRKNMTEEQENEYRNENGLKEHHFNIADAVQYGTDKAVLLYNLRFWLDYNKANKKNIHKHINGKEYYWTFNSGEAFAELFPYMKRRKISRHLRELEEAGVIISGNFNRMRYDRTKWYTIPSLYAVNNE